MYYRCERGAPHTKLIICRRIAKRSILVLFLSMTNGQAMAESLLDVLRLAQENDARWASARSAHQAGQEKIVQGSAALLPTITLKGSYEYTKSDTEYQGPVTYPSGYQNYESGSYGLNLTHPLYRRQNYAQYQQSVSQTAQADAQLGVAETEFLLRVVQTYFDVIVAQDSVGLAEAEVKALSEKRDQATALLEAGASGITDLVDAKARYDLARAREIAARNDLAAKQQALRRITSRDIRALSTLRPGASLPVVIPDDAETWIETAYARSPVIKAQLHAKRAAEWDVERTKGEHYPTLDFVANFSKNRSSGSPYTSIENHTDARNIGFQAQIPIFQGGATSSRVREALANLDKMEHDHRDVRREIENQARNAYFALMNGRSQVQALEQAEESSEKLLDASVMGRKVGIRTWVDVLNAEQQLFSIKRDLSRGRYEYLQNLLKLKAIAGVIGDKDIVEVNDLMTSP